uniref:Uncharacterized protein n=1 Tax=Romanomermis culicivorax TaxID=13658 RepID=A0A915L0I2_ROMCU
MNLFQHEPECSKSSQLLTKCCFVIAPVSNEIISDCTKLYTATTKVDPTAATQSAWKMELDEESAKFSTQPIRLSQELAKLSLLNE